jgi:hypothetical protein
MHIAYLHIIYFSFSILSNERSSHGPCRCLVYGTLKKMLCLYGVGMGIWGPVQNAGLGIKKLVSRRSSSPQQST